MKVSVLQENLAHGLNIVARAVSPRSTLPVLANVLVATDEGRLRLEDGKFCNQPGTGHHLLDWRKDRRRRLNYCPGTHL